MENYRFVKIDGNTIPGENVASVDPPSQFVPYWTILLKDGTRFRTTHPVTVRDEIEQDDQE